MREWMTARLVVAVVYLPNIDTQEWMTWRKKQNVLLGHDGA